MTEADKMKQCPDCAERVRDEALKCRYCGYRFDLRRSARGTRSGGLMRRLRREPALAAPFDLLAEWGVELEPREVVRFWLLARISTEHGYLVVSDRRVMFLEAAGRDRYAKVFEIAIDAIDTLAGPGESERCLRLGGAGDAVALRGLSATAIAEVCDHLHARMAGSRTPPA